MTAPHVRTSSARFPVAVDAALRASGWEPGRWDMQQAEVWADALRAHTSPGGHRHVVFPAVVEAWAEFGALRLRPAGHGRDLAPSPLHIDPVYGLHAARTLSDLGGALGTEVAPLGAEFVAGADVALLAMDAEGRVYGLDHTGDWYLGRDFDAALGTLVTGTFPERLTVGQSP